MTSLHPARRTTERATPPGGSGRTRPQAPGTTSRITAGSRAARLARRAKAAGTVTTAVARTATATAARTAGATAKVAGVTMAAARAAAAGRTPSARRGRAAPVATPEQAIAVTATEPVAVPEVAPAAPEGIRPTPFPRTPAGAAPAADPDAAAPAAPDDAPPGVGQRRGLRRPAASASRPALYLAAALVGAVSISAASAGDPEAKAGTPAGSESISVAEALGVEGETTTRSIVSDETTDRLGGLVASRAERDAEQAEATAVQAAADREAVEAARRAAAAAAEAARPDVVLPVEGARLTSGYGSRWGTLHAGIDLAAPMHTPEYAAMDGVVLEAGPASGFGLAVYIQHENGDVTVYGHMDQILVTAGQVVQAGDRIALLGNTGQSTGPHLHFEVHQGGIDGTKIDPIPWLRAGGVEI